MGWLKSDYEDESIGRFPKGPDDMDSWLLTLCRLSAELFVPQLFIPRTASR
jgi:hypothetical protein